MFSAPSLSLMRSIKIVLCLLLCTSTHGSRVGTRAGPGGEGEGVLLLLGDGFSSLNLEWDGLCGWGHVVVRVMWCRGVGRE